MAAVLTPIANAIIGMIFLMMRPLPSIECRCTRQTKAGTTRPLMWLFVSGEMPAGSKAVRWHPIIFVDPSTVVVVRPVGQAARSIAWGSLEPSEVEVGGVPGLTSGVLR